jgi:hypothetical protein
MLHQLPAELLLHISEYISIGELSRLKRVCRELNGKLLIIEGYLLTNTLKSCKPLCTKDDLYSSIDLFCDHFFLGYKRNVVYTVVYDGLVSQKLDVIDFKGIALEQCSSFIISNVEYVNVLFRRIFQHFLLHGSVQDYPHQMELYVFKMMMGLIARDMTAFYDIVHFSKNVGNTSACFPLIQCYMYHALTMYQSTDTYLIPFDMLIGVSRYCITLGMFKKLMGVRILDLTKSKLLVIPSEQGCIEDIVISKAQLCEDDLVSFNYNQLKVLLEAQCFPCYRELVYKENIEVAKHIYIRNPLTKVNIKYGSIKYKSMLKRMVNLDMFYLKNRVEYEVHQEQNKFRTLLFD